VIFKEKLAAVGFSTVEIGAIAFVLIRLGVIPTCEHSRPCFVECFTLEDVTLSDGTNINDARWRQFMEAMGFRADAIALAEHAIFGGKPGTT
jgi:hypothetical protein